MDDILKELTVTECLVTVISALHTPIAQRRYGEEFNYCVSRVYDELVEKGIIENTNQDLSWLTNAKTI